MVYQKPRAPLNSILILLSLFCSLARQVIDGLRVLMGTRERESQGLSCHGNKPIGPSASLPECSAVAHCVCVFVKELRTTPVAHPSRWLDPGHCALWFSPSLSVRVYVLMKVLIHISTRACGVTIEWEPLCWLNLHQPLCKQNLTGPICHSAPPSP